MPHNSSTPNPLATEASLRQLLQQKGFTDQAIEQQLHELNQLILLSALNDLLQQKPPAKLLKTDEEAATYIQEHFSTEEIQSSLAREADKQILGYLKSIDKPTS